MMLNTFEEETAKNSNLDHLLIESTGPEISAMEIEKQKEEQITMQKKMDNAMKHANDTREKKTNSLLEIEGNSKLNKLSKMAFKKEKKERARREKVALQLLGQLEGFTLSVSDDYGFNTDFVEK